MEPILGWLRLSVRLSFFILYLLGGMLLGVIHRAVDLVSGRQSSRLPTAHRYLIIFCRLIGFRIHLHGQVLQSTHLVVSNHVSWVDIPVIGAVLPVHFLSKAEVRQWPLIGWLAQEAGTLFIKRGAGQSGSVLERLGQTLEAQRSVLVFPEGTTGTGDKVLNFHAKMFRAAVATRTPIQPISLCYVRQGQQDREIPFVGDDDFLAHILRLFRAPRIDAHVVLHAPLIVTADTDAASLATQAQTLAEHGLQRVLQGLEGAPEFGFSPAEEANPAGSADA